MIKTFEKLFYLLFFRKSLLSKPDVSAYFDEMICYSNKVGDWYVIFIKKIILQVFFSSCYNI